MLSNDEIQMASVGEGRVSVEDIQSSEDDSSDLERVRWIRDTERGIIMKRKRLSIAVVFQNGPIWLLGLMHNDINKIYVNAFKSFSDFANHLTDKQLDVTLYNSLVSYLGRGSFVLSPLPTHVLYLISGDVKFLYEKATQPRIKIPLLLG